MQAGDAKLAAPRMHRLYPALLGRRWEDLSASVAALHSRGVTFSGSGTFRVEHGHRAVVSWLVRRLNLPAASSASPVRLRIDRGDTCEAWQRTIGGRQLATLQSASPSGLLEERFGPMELRFRLDVDRGGLVFVQTAWALRAAGLRLPVPRWLSPRVSAREEAGARPGEIGVSVTLTVPWLGCLLAYSGVLQADGHPA